MSAPPAPRTFWRSALKLVAQFVVIGAVLALSITTWANWRREQVFSFRVFDSVWWSRGRSEAQPYVAGARKTAGEVYTAVWGENGMVEKAQEWIDGLRARRAAPAPVPPEIVPSPAPPGAAPAPSPTASKPTGVGIRAQEERFTQAERLFQEGFAAYKQANPQDGGWTTHKKATMRHAAGCFAQARDLLDEAIPAYAGAAGHDPRRLGEARDLERINKQFLVNANKIGGGL
ncbi:MAG: hypothetical protein H0W72_07780 [Planctomycetes bacterium]|nr:hypothetical protein [Planctomycetota bacterium]